MLLEGDYTDKEIPLYFEGMKSVGEDDENGHSVEIVGQNKNLFDINEFKNSDNWISGGTMPYCSFKIKLKPNTKYSFSRKTSEGLGLGVYCLINTVPAGYEGALSWIAHSDNSKPLQIQMKELHATPN